MSESQTVIVSSIVAVQIQRNMREEKFIAYDSDRSKYIVCPRSQSSDHKYKPCSIIEELFEAGAEKAGLLDGLSLEVIVASPAHTARDCQWVATALPYDSQPQKSQKQIDEILSKVRPNPEIKQPKLPEVKPSDLTLACVSRMPMDIIDEWCERYPEYILTKSQQRIRGRLDKDLALVIYLAAKAHGHGAKACDVINAVMWAAVHDGSIWNLDLEGDAES